MNLQVMTVRPVSVFTIPYSGDMPFTPTHPQRSAGGFITGVGHQCELQLSTRLRALLPRCAHLRRERDMERRPAAVLA